MLTNKLNLADKYKSNENILIEKDPQRNFISDGKTLPTIFQCRENKNGDTEALRERDRNSELLNKYDLLFSIHVNTCDYLENYNLL